MRETLKTSIFGVAAIALAVTAAMVEPENYTPAILSDQGQPLFPKLTDPLAVRALEIIEYDEATATARPFKVEFKRGRWIIPSHYNYTADAKDRLAKTAAALVDLKKDLVKSDVAEDHFKYSVIDPLDQKNSSLAGRGKRVTLRDDQGAVLADVILGQSLKEKPGYRYARLPGQKRVYAVKTDADPSGKFEDWIERDLLKASGSAIRKISIFNYSINETLGRVEKADTVVLAREGDKWSVQGGGAPNMTALNSLVGTLDHLKIAGVLPKLGGLADSLRSGKAQVSLESMMSLRQKGFFITPDGRLLAKEGELQFETANGLVYVMRFGEVVSGQTAGPSSKPGEEKPTKPAAPTEDRYLFVTVSYDAAREAKYGGSNGERAARDLSSRFADWYYIIGGSDAAKLRLKRKDLVKG